MSATYTKAIAVVVNDLSAVVSKVEALEVTVEEDVANAVDTLRTEISNVDGRVTGLSENITALSSTVNNVSANLNIRSYVQSSSGSGEALYGVQLRVGSGDDWLNAAYWVEVINGVSSFVVAADRFAVTDSTGTSKQPMVYTNGELTLAIANIGEVTSGLIRSSDNKFVIDLNAGSLRISD